MCRCECEWTIYFDICGRAAIFLDGTFLVLALFVFVGCADVAVWWPTGGVGIGKPDRFITSHIEAPALPKWGQPPQAKICPHILAFGMLDLFCRQGKRQISERK